MVDINDRVQEAKIDQNEIENLVTDYRGFILKTIYGITHRHADIHQNEYSVALEAFIESVHAYDRERGHFLSFSRLVMRRRIIDYLLSQRTQMLETAVDPEHLFRLRAIRDQSDAQDFNQDENLELKWEIEALAEILSSYSIHFSELVRVSPHSEKTRKSCAAASSVLANHPDLVEEMRHSKALPLKTLVEKTGIPRKTLERHRKYIIAVAEIVYGDFPFLREYVRSIVEVMPYESRHP